MEAADRKMRNKVIRRAELRRKREYYRKMFRSAAALLIVMSLATFTLSIRSFAKDRERMESYKYYTSYTVQNGENLSTIAERYINDDYASLDKYMAEVVSINHLLSLKIDAGQKLILPYYSCDMK